jgi:hypothetical protein
VIAGLLTSCQNSNEKRTRFFNTYMQEHFPAFKITDGEYLFVLPGGCFNCNKAVFNTLFTLLTLSPDSNYVDSRYQAILISKNSLNVFSDKVLQLHKTVLCDSTNKLDRMSFGIVGVSVLKIKRGKIVASKSFTIKDYESGSEKFFKEPL